MSEHVIWEREVDHDRINARRRKFLIGFGSFSGACLLLGLIFTGPSNTVGIALVLAALGALMWTWVHYTGLSEQANPTMSLIDNLLVMGNRSIAVSDVRRFTTFATTIQTSLLGNLSRIQVAKALFRTDDPTLTNDKTDPEIVEFGWPKMDEAGIATVTDALKAVLPDVWVEPGDFMDEDELPPPRRPSRRQP